jgi:hypothetical protein
MKLGGFLVGRYYLRPSNDGVFAAATVGAAWFEYSTATAPGSHARTSEVVIGPTVGYTWALRRDLTITPFVGLAFPIYTSGEAKIDAMTYEPPLPFCIHPGVVVACRGR